MCYVECVISGRKVSVKMQLHTHFMILILACVAKFSNAVRSDRVHIKLALLALSAMPIYSATRNTGL
jgi:hypothetical protein